MNKKENWNKEDSVAKVICHAQRSAKKKLRRYHGYPLTNKLRIA